MKTTTPLPSFGSRIGAFRHRLWPLAVLGGLQVIVSTLLAATITFDEPGYIGGQRPPSPWFTYGGFNGYSNTLVQVAGMAGAQYLIVEGSGTGFAENAYYPLPRPLASDQGARRVTVRVAPAGRGSPFGASGGKVGLGYSVGTADVAANWIDFYDWADPPVLESRAKRLSPFSGEIYGENLGSYVPGGWHEITFELNETWTALTISMKRPDGGTSTIVEPVSSQTFDCIICGGSLGSTWSAGPAAFDDLVRPKYRGVFDAIKVTAAGVELRMFGELNQIYDLEFQTDLGGAWSTLATLTNADWTMSYTDHAASNATRFYRLHER